MTNTQNFYPIIVIPESIIDAQNAVISLPIKPDEPTKPTQPDSNFGSSFLVFILSFVFVNLVPIIGLIMFFVALFAIIANYSGKTEYKAALIKYNKLHASYLSDRIKYQNEIKELIFKRQNIYETNKFRQTIINKILNNTPVCNVEHFCVSGKSEIYFLYFLKKYFGSKISINKCIEVFANGNAYVPDYIYIDQSGLHIDIEIDEPYIINSNKPIHFIDEYGNSSDSFRNGYFSGKDWIIIRFAEVQVVTFPNECCGIIADIISKITGKVVIEEKFSELPKVEQWSFNDSINMARSKYREQYLSKLPTYEITEDDVSSYKEYQNIIRHNSNFNWACKYFKLGFNVTCIINEVNQYNQKSNNLLKTPSHLWRDSFDSRQKISHVIGFDWNKSVGIGVLSGFNDIVVIDFDGCSDLEFIYQIIELLHLPITYRWIVRSGSHDGFHIFIKSNRFEWVEDDDAAITRWPTEEYADKFNKVELLFKTHVVVPPSIHLSGNKYEFVNSDFPDELPLYISSDLLEEVINVISLVEQQKIGKNYLLALD